MTPTPPVADDRRSIMAAAALGSCVGLAIGAAYMAGALARATVDDARARMVAGGPVHTSMRGPLAPLSFGAAGPTLRPALSLDALKPPPLRVAASPPRDLECLSQAVYYEARGEAERGREAVAQVVLNRLRHPRFPKSICGVVFQHADSGCAFSFACDGQTRRPLELAAWRDAQRIAQQALRGFVVREVAAATDFRAGLGAPAGLARVAQIGGHVFYRVTNAAAHPAADHAEASAPRPAAVAAPAPAVVKADAPVRAEAAPVTPAA